ncbi:hypothetical protein DMI62_20290 [Escherichia coli]|nr:hypothetical protein [Escherichia coli]
MAREMRRQHRALTCSESLTGVPGFTGTKPTELCARFTAVDLRIWLLPTYGIRGIRLYVDGIPATMPDGQGHYSNIDLSSVKCMLRGPFSALYGNASGGVMNVTTQTGQQPPTIEASSFHGSFGSWRYGLKAMGATGDGNTNPAMSITPSQPHVLRPTAIVTIVAHTKI